MKRKISIFVLGLLLLSIMSFGVLAEDLTVKSGDASKGKAGDNTNINALKEVKDKLKDTKGLVKQVRATFMEAKRNFKEIKSGFLDKKAQLKDSCKGKEDGNCKLVREEFKKNSKDFLLNSADMIMGYLTQTKEKISASNVDNKAELIQKIDDKIARLENIRAEIMLLSENPQIGQIKFLAEKLRVEWKEGRKHLVRSSAYVLSYKIAGLTVQAQKLETKLDKIMTKLKSKGLDISSADVKIKEFGEHIAKAKEFNEQARVKLQSGSLPNEAHELIKQAKQELELARVSLREAVRELKMLEGGREEIEAASIEQPVTEPETSDVVGGTEQEVVSSPQPINTGENVA